jgi:acetyl-CoA carboxylase biotin carboxylase subunit
MVTGRDLVAEQIRIAAGEPVSFAQQDVTLSGHAIECRINAEDASRGFVPGPGRLSAWSMPQGDGLRVDTHCFEGYLVPPFYDSLLAKVIAHGSSRAEAIARMDSALARCRIEGVPTTAPFHRAVLAEEDFRAARVTTRWVEETLLARDKVAA